VDRVLVGDAVWDEIGRLARRRAARLLVVAYVGGDAPELVPPRSDDYVLVDASEKAVRCGQTSPAALMAWADAGAVVESVEDLHAKVMIFGDVAVVGSANLSRNSRDRLIEAAVVATSSPLVRQARTAVADLLTSTRAQRVLLDSSALQDLQRIYNTEPSARRPPPRPGGMVLTPTGRLFVMGIIEDEPFRPDEDDAVKRAFRADRHHLGPAARFARDWMRLDRHWAEELRRGDALVRYDDQVAHPPVLVVDVIQPVDGRRRKIALLLEDRDLAPVDRESFDRRCHELGVGEDGEVRSVRATVGLLRDFGLDGAALVRRTWSVGPDG
jgi:hypothetical protein